MDERLKNIKHNLIESDTVSGKIIYRDMEKHGSEYLNNCDLMGEHLEFLSQQFRQSKSEIIIMINTQISIGIQELSDRNDWVNLGKVAKHALEEKLEVVRRNDEKYLKPIIKVVENTLEFMNLSLDDQNKALNSLEDEEDE
jgi:hypothetical protein